jgi:hypothetical protein
VIRFALALAVVAATTSAFVSDAEPQPFAKDLTFEGENFSLVETGVMKARALLTSVTISEFAKYVAREQPEQRSGRQLLVLHLARNLSKDQLQQIFRGVVRGRPGYSEAQLDAFLGLLPSAKTGSVLRLCSNATGKLEVFAGNTLAGFVVAPQLAAAVWAGFGGAPVKSPSATPK